MADPTVPVAPVSQAVQAAVTKDLNQILAAIGTVQDLPENLPPPDRAIVLSGTMVAPPPADPTIVKQQLAVVQTALGNLTLNLSTAVQSGPVTVQIQPGNPPTVRVLVPSPDAATTSHAAAAAPSETQQAIQPAALSAAAVPPKAPPIQAGQVISGTFVPTPQPPAAAPPIASAEMELPTEQPSFLSASSPLLAQESNNALPSTSPPLVAPPSLPQSYLVLGVTPPAGQPLPVAAGTGPVLPAVAQSSTPTVQNSPAPAASAPTQLAQAAQPNSVPAVAPSPASPPAPSGIDQPPAVGLPSPAAPSLPTSTPASATPTPASSASAAPVSTPQGSTLPATPANAAAQTPVAQTLLTPSAAQAPSTSQAGNQSAPVPIDPTYMPPSMPSAAPPAAASPTSAPANTPIAATVIASSSNQQPVLAVPNGTIIINQAVSVPPGTVLSLQSLAPEQVAALRASLPMVPAPITREAWPALAQGLSQLTANPAALAAASRFIPAIDQNFVATFVAYLTKEGNARKDDTATILHDLKIDAEDAPSLRAALGQLQSDVGRNTNAAAQNWHNFPVPLLTDAGLTMVQLYIHQQNTLRDDEKSQKNTSQKTTRFLFEVHPSALGPVQIDGLLRKETKPLQPTPVHLDLIVRSEATIPPEDAQELQGLFIDSLGASGLTGRLSFQFGRENFIQPESGVGTQVEVKA